MGAVIFKGKLPPRERELAVLRIGWLLRAPYEWSERDAAILSAVEQMLTDQSVKDETWAVLASGWDDAQLIEFTMRVGQYVATGLLQNVPRIRLAPDNPGLTAR